MWMDIPSHHVCQSNHIGASCADILRASAGFIGRRLTLVHHLY